MSAFLSVFNIYSSQNERYRGFCPSRLKRVESTKDRNVIRLMTTHLYSSVPLPLRISLVLIATFLLFATRIEVAAQQPSISVRDAVVVEGNSGTTQATFVVALSAASSQSVSCSFATSNGTATAGS